MIQRLLRTLGDFVPLGGVALGIGVVIALIHRTSGTLSEVASFHHVTETEIARALADELAHLVVTESAGSASHESSLTRNGFECRAILSSRELQRVVSVVVKRRGGSAYHYTSSVLAGSAPRALGVRVALCTVARERVHDLCARLRQRDVEPTWLSPDRFPETLKDDAPSVSLGMYGVKRDDSIALTRLASGTDSPDYVFDTSADGSVHLHVPACGVLVVEGNLWIDDVGPVITAKIDSALTIVVLGNLYLGQSLRVEGEGRLTLVAEGMGPGFVDLNLDGRWAPGEGDDGFPMRDGRIEGSGSLYIGIPGRSSYAVDLHCDASIVCQGEAYLLAETVCFAGSLALGGGWLQWQSVTDLRFSGEKVGNVQRVRVPGFAVIGAPRPAVLDER